MSKLNFKIKLKNKRSGLTSRKIASRVFVVDKTITGRRSLLYRIVYSTKLCFVTTFLLLLSFFSQGAFVVYANEVTSESVPVSLVAEQTLTQEFVPVESESKPVVSMSEVPADKAVAVTLNESPVENLMFDYISDEVSSAATTSLDITVEESTLDLDTSITSDSLLENNDQVLTLTNEVLEIQVADISSTTLPLAEEAITVNYSDSAFTFKKSECTQLATGSYYCIEPHTNDLADSLFSAPDADGDLEIFLVKNGIQTQVTNNMVDDAAPFFDPNSNTLVWHRLIDDRYQIVSYSLATGEETVLTHNSTNDMEPTRQGKYTAWQRWQDNNWEIILFNGVREEVISNSTAHDMAPYIHGSLVVWNRYSAAGQKTIEMYDISSQTYVTVDDPEGLSVTNPRMVFVYDSLHPNGDIVTKGYDLISRQFINLDSLPRKLPEDLPKSDSTGETRALIQSKPSIKGEAIKNVEKTGPVPPVDLLPAYGTSTVSTIDMRQASSSVTFLATSSASEIILNEVDNEIEPLYIPPLNPDIDLNTVQE